MSNFRAGYVLSVNADFNNHQRCDTLRLRWPAVLERKLLLALCVAVALCLQRCCSSMLLPHGLIRKKFPSSVHDY